MWNLNYVEFRNKKVLAFLFLLYLSMCLHATVHIERSETALWSSPLHRVVLRVELRLSGLAAIFHSVILLPMVHLISDVKMI